MPLLAFNHNALSYESLQTRWVEGERLAPSADATEVPENGVNGPELWERHSVKEWSYGYLGNCFFVSDIYTYISKDNYIYTWCNYLI